MKTTVQFPSGLMALAAKSAALVLALASANLASAQTNNTRTGVNAGASITTGDENNSDGFSALRLNTGGSQNTAVGSLSLQNNKTGLYNTAVGYKALTVNTAASLACFSPPAGSRRTSRT